MTTSVIYFPRAVVRKLKARHRRSRNLKKGNPFVEYDEYVYALVGAGKRVVRAEPLRNVAEIKWGHHELSSEDITRVRGKASTDGYKIIGYFHNHPLSKAEPGSGDTKSYRGHILCIHSPIHREFRCFYIPVRGRPKELQIKFTPKNKF